MYKVYFVDDEELVIKSLIASVDWQSYGFEVAGYALSGYEAFEAIQTVKPHLVFTDIRMPGISGLELIKMLKDASSQALMVVLSGYAEFALAQKAINYGAVGYCLKPFDELEIAGFLKKASSMLANEELNKSVDILECLELETTESRNKLSKLMLEAGIYPGAEQKLMVVVSVGRSELNKNKVTLQPSITIPIGRRKYAYLLQENAELREQLDAYTDPNHEIRGVGISDSFAGIDGIQQAIQEGELRAYHFFTGIGSMNVQFLKETPNRIATIKEIERAIANKSLIGIMNALDHANVLFTTGLMNIQDALTLFNQVVGFIDREQDLLWEEFIYSYDQLTETFGSVQEVIAYLKDMLMSNSKQVGTTAVQPIKNRLFKSILDYVDMHYREELTITMLSERFNVNANYISQLFRKETGMAFTQYVMARRIDHACELLSGTDLPIHEVAEQAGYSDYFYFSRIFKRIKGITPSGYRA